MRFYPLLNDLIKFSVQKVVILLREQLKTLNVPYLDLMVNQSRDPFKVLISCILSLRTQDRTTAKASEKLFSIINTPQELSQLPTKEIERAIYPVGFYRTKAERIKEISSTLCSEYEGIVPDKIDELLKFKGVGRKTANLVVTLGYNKYGICVDTHVHRITNRWGFVNTKNPTETEMTLRKKLPQKYWKEINGLLVAFGQGVCRPVSPKCSECLVSSYCPSFHLSK